jgi:hypothetical protein
MSTADFSKLLPVIRELEAMDWAERALIAKAINHINMQVDLIVDYPKLEELEERFAQHLESRQISDILTGRLPLDQVNDELFEKLGKDPRFEYLLIERFKQLGINLNDHEGLLDRWVNSDNRDAMVTHTTGIPSHGENSGIPIEDSNNFAIPPTEHSLMTADSAAQTEGSVQSADPAGNPVTIVGAEQVSTTASATTDINTRTANRHSGKK